MLREIVELRARHQHAPRVRVEARPLAHALGRLPAGVAHLYVNKSGG